MTDPPEGIASNSMDANTQNTPVDDDTGNHKDASPDDEHINEWLNTVLVEFKNDYDLTCEIKVQEYLDITTTQFTNPACWLEAGSLDVAFALLTARKGPKNVCALTIQQGVELFNFIMGDDPMSELLEKGTVGPALKDAKKRYIVVPVNDGPLRAKGMEEMYKAEKARKEKENDDAQEEGVKEVEEGDAIEVEEISAQDEPFIREGNDLERTHEDTATPGATQGVAGKRSKSGVKKPKKQTKHCGGKPKQPPQEPPQEPPQKTLSAGSHWGLLVVDKKEKIARWIDGNLKLNNGKLPHDMSPAAEVAGKILCGIEQVLGSERGMYNAKTAKYVPHQRRDNFFQDDDGACGPYVFAFLEYLYKHQSYMSKLRTAFNRRHWQKHCDELAFDSLYTRVGMQELIQNKSEEDAVPGELSLKMTPDVFRILHPKVVAPWVATAWRDRAGAPDGKGMFDRYEFRKHGRYRPGGGGGTGGGTGGGGGRGGRGGRGGYNPPPPPPPGSKRKEVWDTDDEDRADDNFTGDMNDPENSTTSKKLLRTIMRDHKDVYRGREKEESYRLAWENKRNEEIILAAEAAAQATTHAPPPRAMNPILQPLDPDGSIPEDFADEQAVPSEQIKIWRERNMDHIKKCELGAKAADDGISIRAVLQVLSGARFSDESDHRLINTWINDPEVFTDEERKEGTSLTPKAIAERMATKYEVFDMTKRTAKKRSPDGQDDTGANKKPKTVEVNWAYISDIIGNETPDFTHMTDSRVEEWAGLLPKALGVTDSMNPWCQRAILQKLFGGFDGLSEKDKSVWLKEHPDLKGKEINVDDVTSMLQESVKTVPTPKLKGALNFYPKWYQEEFAARHPEGPGLTKPDPKSNPAEAADGLDDFSSDSTHTSDEDDPDAPSGKSTKPSTTPKNKQNAANNGGASADKSKRGPPDFLRMSHDDLFTWTKKIRPEHKAELLDSKNQLAHPERARIYLERIFKKTFQTWDAEDPLSDASLKEIRKWKKSNKLGVLYSGKHPQEAKRFLKEQLLPKMVAKEKGKSSEKVELKLPDYSNNQDHWPDAWK